MLSVPKIDSKAAAGINAKNDINMVINLIKQIVKRRASGVPENKALGMAACSAEEYEAALGKKNLGAIDALEEAITE